MNIPSVSAQTNMAHTEIFHQLRPSILVIFLTAMSQMTTCYSRSAGHVSVKVKLFCFFFKNLITVATCAFKALMDTSSSFDYAIHFRSCGGYFQLTEHHTLRPSIAIFQINSNVARWFFKKCVKKWRESQGKLELAHVQPWTSFTRNEYSKLFKFQLKLPEKCWFKSWSDYMTTLLFTNSVV